MLGALHSDLASGEYISDNHTFGSRDTTNKVSDVVSSIFSRKAALTSNKISIMDSVEALTREVQEIEKQIAKQQHRTQSRTTSVPSANSSPDDDAPLELQPFLLANDSEVSTSKWTGSKHDNILEQYYIHYQNSSNTSALPRPSTVDEDGVESLQCIRDEDTGRQNSSNRKGATHDAGLASGKVARSSTTFVKKSLRSATPQRSMNSAASGIQHMSTPMSSRKVAPTVSSPDTELFLLESQSGTSVNHGGQKNGAASPSPSRSSAVANRSATPTPTKFAGAVQHPRPWGANHTANSKASSLDQASNNSIPRASSTVNAALPMMTARGVRASSTQGGSSANRPASRPPTPQQLSANLKAEASGPSSKVRPGTTSSRTGSSSNSTFVVRGPGARRALGSAIEPSDNLPRRTTPARRSATPVSSNQILNSHQHLKREPTCSIEDGASSYRDDKYVDNTQTIGIQGKKSSITVKSDWSEASSEFGDGTLQSARQRIGQVNEEATTDEHEMMVQGSRWQPSREFSTQPSPSEYKNTQMMKSRGNTHNQNPRANDSPRKSLRTDDRETNLAKSRRTPAYENVNMTSTTPSATSKPTQGKNSTYQSGEAVDIAMLGESVPELRARVTSLETELSYLRTSHDLLSHKYHEYRAQTDHRMAQMLTQLEAALQWIRQVDDYAAAFGGASANHLNPSSVSSNGNISVCNEGPTETQVPAPPNNASFGNHLGEDGMSTLSPVRRLDLTDEYSYADQSFTSHAPSHVLSRSLGAAEAVMNHPATDDARVHPPPRSPLQIRKVTREQQRDNSWNVRELNMEE